ncbi:hypothetical protein S40288_11275 [Stachybotrys chartarum IBT 40288]|nr:hypothetical protein S40288_11275 [Stachybotrys chartarum IBT 40288]
MDLVSDDEGTAAPEDSTAADNNITVPNTTEDKMDLLEEASEAIKEEHKREIIRMRLKSAKQAPLNSMREHDLDAARVSQIGILGCIQGLSAALYAKD